MLLAAGAYAKARLPHDKLKGLNGLAWECYQVAALTTNPHLVRSTVMAMLRETDIAFQRRAPRLAEGFASMPDFEMTMVWEFSSWIPFVSGLLPKDTMTIRKRGTALRMDSTLLGMSGMTWQRGDVSQIVRVQAERGSHEGQFLLLDNKARTAGDGRESFLCPEDKNVQDWVRKVLSTPQKVSDWWSKDTTFKQVFTKGWLGGTTTDPKTADVDVWTGCTLYDMAGLKQTELTHAAIRKDLTLADWWLPVYEKAKWSALEAGAAPDSVDLHQHSGALVEDRPEAGLAPLTSALAAMGGGEAGTATAAAATKAAEDAAAGKGDSGQGLHGAAASAKTVRRVNFMSHFKGLKAGHVLEYDHNTNNYGVPGMKVFRGHKDVDEGAVDALLAELGAEPVTGTATPAPGATPVPGKAPATTERPPDCPAGVAAREGDHIASHNMGVVQEANTSVEEKVMDCQVAFHPGFPLTREQMLPIAAALARTGAHFDNFKRFFEHHMPPEAGFPVRFSIPVFPTVTATITFGECNLVTPAEELFSVPKDYAMGEYEEQGFIRQL